MPLSDLQRHDSAVRTRTAALVSLLGDDSEQVRDTVRKELLALRKAALPALNAATRSTDAATRGRARTIRAELGRERILRGLYRQLLRPQPRLERGLLALARLEDPHLDPRPLWQELDAMAHVVGARARHSGDATERALALSDHLGKTLGFGGSKGNYHDACNIHLHTALRARQGMPLTMCAIWSFVAKRAGVRTGLIPLPGHVMLRVHGESNAVIIDPYHKGVVRSDRDLKRYLRENGVNFDPAYLRDAPEGVFLRRQVANLARSTELRGLHTQSRELMKALAFLERRSVRVAKTT